MNKSVKIGLMLFGLGAVVGHLGSNYLILSRIRNAGVPLSSVDDIFTLANNYGVFAWTVGDVSKELEVNQKTSYKILKTVLDIAGEHPELFVSDPRLVEVGFLMEFDKITKNLDSGPESP